MEAGLAVGNANPKFFVGDSAGDSRIHITNDDDPVRPLRDADFLEGDHDARRWLRVGSGIWRSSKELARQLGIVMLPGVDQPYF